MKEIPIKIYSIFVWFIWAIMVIFFWALAPSIVIIFRADSLEIYNRLGKIWAKISLVVGGAKLMVEGLENITSNLPVIFASNHQSYLDISILTSILPLRVRYIAIDELFRIPFYGSYIKNMGAISVKQNDVKESYKTLLKAIKIVRAGESMIIFPEHRRTWTGELGPFEDGVATIALNAKVPVIPIAIDGAFKILPRGQWTFHPNEVKVKIGKPLTFESHYPDKSTCKRATGKIRDSIEALLSSSNP